MTDDVRVLAGDCIEVMRTLDADSIDAVITDPPYGIGFMGHEWDQPGEFGSIRANGEPGLDERVAPSRRRRQPHPSTGAGHARERERFGGSTGRDNRTHTLRGGAMHAGRYDLSHSANARFQAWTEAWAGEAFRILKPGGHLVSFCGTRTSHRMVCGIEDAGFEIRDTLAWLYGSGFPKSLNVAAKISPAIDEEGHTDPALDALAAPWDGWGTALKPAHEPITLARKPLRGTVAANVLEHGTGALNIDACRIGTESTRRDTGSAAIWGQAGRIEGGSDSGRWPANVILDPDAAALLDELAAGNMPAKRAGIGYGAGARGTESGERIPLDSGGASRFFYTAKASWRDRGDGTHPTVKPRRLMQWLVRLLVAEGGVVLDPFAGTGSTGVACRYEGVRCVLIEREAEYVAIIEDRLSRVSRTVRS